MKERLLVANWKANKTVKEAVEFAQDFGEAVAQSSVGTVLCAPFQCLQTLFALTEEFNFKVGAQNVSRVDNGAYTGEVTAQMLKEVSTHCIVGHSERWRYFGENSESVIQKVGRLIAVDVTPILCIADEKQLNVYAADKVIVAASEKIVFVHEPPGAISGGKDYHPQDPHQANESVKEVKEKFGKDVVTLYGGSVNPDNINQFLEQDHINGFLVGQASLRVDSFTALVSSISR